MFNEKRSPDMNLDGICKIIDRQLIKTQNRPLSSVEITVLQGIWQYQTYNQIAMEAGYSPGYFTNVVAPELYQRLAEAVGQKVTKKNCRKLLESYCDRLPEIKPWRLNLANYDSEKQNTPSYPSGSIPLNSSFYLERSPQKSQIERELAKPGALIRIKAPREMGKTSLLIRSLNYAEGLGYRTVCLNLEQVETSILKDLERFLRWLCASTSRHLQQKLDLDEYWDEDLGGKVSSTLFFQDGILESLDTPLVLALDEVDRIFEYPALAKDFLPLLRSWYEEGKRLLIWQKLRIIVVHSTEIYVPLDLDRSPFNVGLPIQLDNFTLEQVRQLARSYGLQNAEIEQLMSLVGGHPALVNLALYYWSRPEANQEQLLQTATDATGIYAHHLQRHWVALNGQPELLQVFNVVINSEEPVILDPIQIHKLYSMGLIEIVDGKAIARCQLYKQYFANLLGSNF